MMRHWKWLAGLVVALGFAAPSFAQVNNAAFGGIDPRMLRNQPISSSSSVVPIAQPQFFNHTFSLANFLPNFSKFSAQNTMGQSQYPTSYQPDMSFFSAFGLRRLTPINVPY
jgi:hypothetical protein